MVFIGTKNPGGAAMNLMILPMLFFVTSPTSSKDTRKYITDARNLYHEYDKYGKPINK